VNIERVLNLASRLELDEVWDGDGGEDADDRDDDHQLDQGEAPSQSAHASTFRFPAAAANSA
jgi:hypothetical protein